MTRVTAARNTVQLDAAMAAARPRKRPCSQPDSGALLHIPATRVAAPEEPVDASRALTRVPLPWETDLITAVRLTERRRERAQVEGLT